MIQYTTKMELNVIDRKTNPAQVGQFLVKNSCPAVVVLPELVAPFMVDRSIKRGRYKIICMVDFPDGKNFAMQKLRDLSNDAMAADGFDIVCSKNKTFTESLNEVKSLHEFVRKVNPITEVRWIINPNDEKEIEMYLEAVSKFPCNYLRIGHQLTRNPTFKIDDYQRIIKLIRAKVAYPIKLSGDVSMELMAAFKDDRGVRFDVSLNQANIIVNTQYEQTKTQTKTQLAQESQTTQKIIELDENVK